MANIFKHVLISEEITYIGPAPVTISPDLPIDQSRLDDDKKARKQALWQSGYNQGVLDGQSQERGLLQAQFQSLKALLQTIPQAIADNRQLLSSEIADIVLMIVSKFFIHQQQNKENIANQINLIISQLNEKQNLEILLHPHDLALVQQGDINLDLSECKHPHFKADERLRLGGCIINTEHGAFDSGIERQIDHLKQVLLKMKRDAS